MKNHFERALTAQTRRASALHLRAARLRIPLFFLFVFDQCLHQISAIASINLNLHECSLMVVFFCFETPSQFWRLLLLERLPFV